MRTVKRKFTDRYLKSIKLKRPGEPGYGGFLWDAALPHFGAKVTGELGFYVGLRSPVTRKWIEKKLGNFPVMSIAAAHEQALPIIAALRGGNPLPKSGAPTFAEVLDEYAETVLPGKDTAKEIEQKLRKEALPALGARPIASIRHEDIVALLGNVAARNVRNSTGSKLKSGGRHAARKLFAQLSPLFKWARHERKIEVNPMADVPVQLIIGTGFNLVRDHLISDADLRTIWQAAGALGYPFGVLVRLLIMCGARLNEIARLTRDEIRGDTIVLAAPRTKNNEARTIPVPGPMRSVVDGLPDFGPGTFLFSTDGGRTAISGFSRFKRRLDNTIAEPVERWQLHDLRRLCRTGLSRAGVETMHAELCIGHRRQGVERIYDRYTFDAQKRAAFERWQELLASIVEPPPANVVPIRVAAV